MAPILCLAGGAAMVLCQWLVFYYTPTEAAMGLIQKIFYIHLPLAWWALFSFFLVFTGSIIYIWKRSPKVDAFCAAATEIGVLFSGLALLTGIIWAKKSWGVWWTWDPRLTTTLVMWFIYAACLLLRKMDMATDRKRLVCAAMGIVAFLDVPLVFVSARIFRSIHPAVFANPGGGLENEMKLAVIACITALGLLWLGILLLRARQLSIKDTLDALMLNHILR